MGQEHFKPSMVRDPQEQRKLVAHLEQIDFATFDANRVLLAKSVGRVDLGTFKRLANMAAAARATWVKEALAISDKGVAPTEAQIKHLALLRSTFEELSEAYEATRRMVERGYLCYLETGG
jgi:hypothetical protein